MTSVSIRETITLSLPDSAVSCPDLEPISTQLWAQQLANNGHTHKNQVTEGNQVNAGKLRTCIHAVQ